MPMTLVNLNKSCLANDCVFCMKGQEERDLHQVLMFDANDNIQTMVTVLQDTELLARIDGGNLIAKETKNHLNCLTNLRNHYRSHIRKLNQEEEKAQTVEENMNISRVFVDQHLKERIRKQHQHLKEGVRRQHQHLKEGVRIQHRHLKEGVRRQHCRHGRLMKRSHKYLHVWLLTPSNVWILTLNTSRR